MSGKYKTYLNSKVNCDEGKNSLATFYEKYQQKKPGTQPRMSGIEPYILSNISKKRKTFTIGLWNFKAIQNIKIETLYHWGKVLLTLWANTLNQKKLQRSTKAALGPSSLYKFVFFLL